LIQGLGGAEAIAFAAQFAFRGWRAGALLAGTRRGLRQFLGQVGSGKILSTTVQDRRNNQAFWRQGCHGLPLILGGFSYG